jgi:glycosyltransferase involved in cell wall biosynthesis
MKILLEHPRSSTYDPTNYPGGVEKWVTHTFNLLRDSGYDVKLLVCADTSFDDPDFIHVSLEHRKYEVKKFGTFDYARYFRELDEISNDFDLVILSSMCGSMKILEFPKLCSKILFFQHYYESCNRSIMNYGMWHGMKYIRSVGGRCVPPNNWVREKGNYFYKLRQDNDAFLARIPQRHREWFMPITEIDLYDEGTYDVLHHLSDAADIKEVNPKKISFVGRPVVDKGIVETAIAMKNLDSEGYECHIFTREDGYKDERMDRVREILNGSQVQIHLRVPHTEIMKELADTNVLLWPTRQETVGIVGYEGAAHGCRVVYTIDPPDEHLQPSGQVFKRHWSNGHQLSDVAKEVMGAEFDREACVNFFRTKYTTENDLKRLEMWIKST